MENEILLKQIKEYREAQKKVFEINQEILDLKDKLYPFEIVKHYYTVVFTKKLGKDFNFKISDIEKQMGV